MKWGCLKSLGTGRCNERLCRDGFHALLRLIWLGNEGYLNFAASGFKPFLCFSVEFMRREQHQPWALDGNDPALEAAAGLRPPIDAIGV